jgi:hypothetical protein
MNFQSKESCSPATKWLGLFRGNSWVRSLPSLCSADAVGVDEGRCLEIFSFGCGKGLSI